MTHRYLIEACNEPHGEGNGWELCPDAAATSFLVWSVWEDDAEECLAALRTREEAKEYIANIWEDALHAYTGALRRKEIL
jgi:hypothetical protein